MNVGIFFGLLGSLLGTVLGTIGSIIGTAVNRRILQDVGLSTLPKDPKQRYRLIAERCAYIRTWTKMDTYNISVFILGLLFLIAGLILELIEAATRTPVTVDGFPITLFLLVIALIFLPLSFFMVISRLLMLMNLLKYAEGVELREPIEVEDQKKDSPRHYLTIWIVPCLTAPYVISSLFIIKKFGLPLFFGVTLLFIIAVIGISLWDVKRNKKLNSSH